VPPNQKKTDTRGKKGNSQGPRGMKGGKENSTGVVARLQVQERQRRNWSRGGRGFLLGKRAWKTQVTKQGKNFIVKHVRTKIKEERGSDEGLRRTVRGQTQRKERFETRREKKGV